MEERGNVDNLNKGVQDLTVCKDTNISVACCHLSVEPAVGIIQDIIVVVRGDDG